MSTAIFRPFSSATRASKRVAVASIPALRSFHSPFTVLGSSPITTPQKVTAQASHYEKQYDHTHEPIISTTGYRTYVVSEPDASYRHYKVPAGAYPTSAPYVNFTATDAPKTNGALFSSTSSSILAHPFTTRAALQHNGGVGESSAIRHSSSPGEMGARGGSYGGMKLMDEKGTTAGVGHLAERNPPPDGSFAEKFSKAGVDNAWKLRK